MSIHQHHADSSSARRWVHILLITFIASAALGWLARRWSEIQWELAANGVIPVYEKSVLFHGLAITAIVALALAVAVPLIRTGFGVLALLVCVGVGFGPLGLVVAPVFASPTNWEGTDLASTLWTWLGALLLAALVAGAALFLASPGEYATAPPIRMAAGGAVMLLPLVILATIPSGTEVFPWFMDMPTMLATLGWGLLAGGLTAVGLLAVDPVRASLLRLVLAGLVPLLSYWAYQRPGGAPEVPGWDYSDSAEVLTATLATAVVLGAVAGLILRVTRVGEHLSSAAGAMNETREPAVTK
jgi:hypothetical protein